MHEKKVDSTMKKPMVVPMLLMLIGVAGILKLIDG